MEHIYGFFITLAMLMTTTLMFGYLRFVRHWNLVLVMLIMAVFFSVEIAYFIANAVNILNVRGSCSVCLLLWQ